MRANVSYKPFMTSLKEPDSSLPQLDLYAAAWPLCLVLSLLPRSYAADLGMPTSTKDLKERLVR